MTPPNVRQFNKKTLKCQMSVRYTKNYHSRPSKKYQNWDFWFENVPSGNPGRPPLQGVANQHYYLESSVGNV
jgi:hypothetical protein